MGKTRKQKPKNEFVLICPKCNSTDTSTDFSNPGLVGTGLFHNAKVCNNCGYSSEFFPEVEGKNLPKVKKTVEKRVLVNTTYGRNINWFWRFLGPFGIVASVLYSIFSFGSIYSFWAFFGLLPCSIVITVAAYRGDLLKKYPALRLVFLFIYFWALFLLPMILIYYLHIYV